jgi:CheY-like chemotaxis protein
LRKLTETDQSESTLILMDINMPNEWEFLEAYRQSGVHEKDKNVVVVLTTSMNPEGKLKAGEISCVAEFNIKPLIPAMFTNILEKYQ